MSGHSHFKSIKYKKGVEDKKRGKIFSKLSRQISIAVREKGGDMEANSSLKMAVEKSKEFNMPKENVERAIKRGTGELEGEKLEEIIFEALGPCGVSIIIEGITDNKNRAMAEIRQILIQNQGKLVGEGAVKWLFERKGCITLRITNSDELRIKDKERLELAAIEAGAEDVSWQDDVLEIYTKPEEIEMAKKNLEQKEIKIDSASLNWQAKEMLELSDKEKESCQKLFEELDELDSVQEIYANIQL